MFIWLLVTGSVFRATACGVPCRRAGRETAHGSRGLRGMQWLWSDGGQEGGRPCTQSVPQGKAALPYRNRDAGMRLQKLAICTRATAVKKACAPFGDTGRKSRLVKGEFEGKALSHRQQRCDRMAARRAVPVATQEATGIVEIRDSLPPKGPGLPAVMPCWADQRAGQSP